MGLVGGWLASLVWNHCQFDGLILTNVSWYETQIAIAEARQRNILIGSGVGLFLGLSLDVGIGIYRRRNADRISMDAPTTK